MKIRRRQFLHLAAGAAGVAASGVARAQTYPSRPITMIVPGAAGGPSDLIGRTVAERMRQSLGQPVIIENVTGADGTIAAGRTSRARPDGYTIDIRYLGDVLNGALYSLPYDVFNDFAPISPLAATSIVLFARKTLAAKDLKELIAWLKANPNRASAGIGGTGIRLWYPLFQRETGTQFTLVPYRGGVAQAMLDLVAGHIDLALGSPDVGLSQMRAGSVKAYAVGNDRRMALAPNIPTFTELGLPALSYSPWYALVAPKGTPADIIDKLNAAAVAALAVPAVRSRLVELGFEIFPREQQTPEALDALQRATAEKWWPLIREFGIKAE
jgi:tripartite-type tricarboxylate transporter receptor subunit TctC